MLKNIFFIGLTFIVLASCQKEDSGVHIQLKEPVFREANYEYVPIKGMPDYYFGFGACVLGDYLLIYENTPYRRYNLVDLKRRERIRTFGQEEGPYKINYSYCNCQHIAKGDSLFTILNDGGREHILFDLAKNREDQGFFYKKLELPEGIIMTNPAYLSKDEKKLFGFSSAKPGVFSFDLETKKTTLFPMGPKLKINTDQTTRSNIFFATTAIDKNGKLFGVSFNYFNLIEIYDPSFNLVRSITIGKPQFQIPEMVENAPIGSTIIYSGYILIGEKNIYVLYYNQELNSIDRNTSEKVLIINLENNSVRGIKIPTRITSLSLDSEENFLYATAEDDSHKQGNLIRISLK